MKLVHSDSLMLKVKILIVRYLKPVKLKVVPPLHINNSDFTILNVPALLLTQKEAQTYQQI